MQIIFFLVILRKGLFDSWNVYTYISKATVNRWKMELILTSSANSYHANVGLFPSFILFRSRERGRKKKFSLINKRSFLPWVEQTAFSFIGQSSKQYIIIIVYNYLSSMYTHFELLFLCLTTFYSYGWCPST